jgi:tetratricopeptide (TPR) repeat protein
MLYHHPKDKEDGRMDGENRIKKAYESILKGDYEEAIAWFEEAMELDPENASYYYKCSITCARSGKWDKAIQYADQSVRLDEENAEYQFHQQTVRAKLLLIRAEVLMAAEPPDYAAAIHVLKEATKLDPLLLDAFLLLGLAYGGLLQYTEAASYVKEAIKLDPGHSGAKRWFAEFNRKRREQQRRLPGQNKGNGNRR